MIQRTWYSIGRKFEKKGYIIMWLVLAILSSVFAALTSILAKIGIDGVNSNLATAILSSVSVRR